MTTTQKQNFIRNLEYAMKFLAEACGEMKEAQEVIREEIKQLYIGRLLTMKKGASDEMFELSEEKSALADMIEKLNAFSDIVEKFYNKHK